jgi:hypothetical protein
VLRPPQTQKNFRSPRRIRPVTSYRTNVRRASCGKGMNLFLGNREKIVSGQEWWVWTVCLIEACECLKQHRER